MKKVNASPYLYANNNSCSFIDLTGKAPTKPGNLIDEIHKISEQPENKLLGIVIDMQGEHWHNAYYQETRLLENQKKVLDVLTEKKAKVIFIESNFGEPETNSLLRKAAPDAERMIKPQLNAFSSWQVRVELKNGNYTHAIVMGTECENCVESTIMGDFEGELSLVNHQGANQLTNVLTAPQLLDALETRAQSQPLFINPEVESRFQYLQQQLRQDMTNEEYIKELEQIRSNEHFRVDAPNELPMRAHPRVRILSDL